SAESILAVYSSRSRRPSEAQRSYMNQEELSTPKSKTISPPPYPPSRPPLPPAPPHPPLCLPPPYPPCCPPQPPPLCWPHAPPPCPQPPLPRSVPRERSKRPERSRSD